MNDCFAGFLEKCKGKKIAIVGMGISNRPVFNVLRQQGMRPDLFDEKYDLQEIKRYQSIGAGSIFFGPGSLDALKGYDLIFKTPAMRPDLPAFNEERNRGAEITSEMSIFMQCCPCRTIGVTGSDGKSTTTTLIAEMLKKRFRVWVGGNLGTPLFDQLFSITSKDIVVLELSSFQLMTMNKSPDVAVITNITPNHLDVHKNMDEYVQAKKNILDFQDEHGISIVNLDNEITESIYKQRVHMGNMIGFTKSLPPKGCVGRMHRQIVYKDDKGGCEKWLDTAHIKLLGTHNLENVMAACAAVKGLVSFEDMQKIAYTFEGLEHRREYVGRVNDRAFYNDSIATSPIRCAATLETFAQKVILIAGGKDKKSDYAVLVRAIIKHVKVLILTGSNASTIENALMKSERAQTIEICKTHTLKDAVTTAFERSDVGDIILLSPAGTSFDAFANFEERGRFFKDQVKRLELHSKDQNL